MTFRRPSPSSPARASTATGGARSRALRLAAAGVVTLATLAAVTTGIAPRASAGDGAVLQPNVEEQRLGVTRPGEQIPYSQEAISSGGFDTLLTAFETALADTSADQIDTVVSAHARGLWTHAVEEARAALAQDDHSSGDDRGLYWARLQMRLDLKAWAAGEGLSDDRVAALLHTLEYASRGIPDAGFDPSWTGRRVLLSGFDPFFLDGEIAQPNPSGVVALSLDGAVLHDAHGDVLVHTVMLPVNWSDFDAGIVEDAFGPSLRTGAGSADMTMTVSQSGPGFDIERWAGAWRGGGPDNLNDDRQQLIPAASAWPATTDGAQFIETTLPADAMVSAGTGPYDVKINELICTAPTAQRLAAETTCTSPTEFVQPSPQVFAVEGGGGSYLSNESMYRVNRLRVGLGRDDIAGGHLHIPPIDLGNEESSRRTVLDQSIQLIRAAAAALADDTVHLDLQKTTTTRSAAADSTVTYSYVVTNTGATTLSAVTLDDDETALSAIECDAALPASLVPGARLTCSSRRTVTEDDTTRSVLTPGTATATGVTAKGRSATVTATAAAVEMIPTSSPSPSASTTPTPVTSPTPTVSPTTASAQAGVAQTGAGGTTGHLATTGTSGESAAMVALVGLSVVLLGCGAVAVARVRRQRARTVRPTR